MKSMISYAQGIKRAIEESLLEFPELIAIGQGLWSPFYVGSTMEKLQVKFSKDRVIDSPVSENATTAMALGVAIAGGRALVVHPRIDFMILAADPLVNAIAKWRSALAYEAKLPLTVRAIINRGGEQGAQHSQSLYSWFAHVPGLRVVAPSNALDAYRLLKQSLMCEDPVIFVEDRWDYDQETEMNEEQVLGPLKLESSTVVRVGTDVTLWGVGHTVRLALQAAEILSQQGIDCEVIDQRILAPFDCTVSLKSTEKTGKLITVENAWPVASMSSEVIARISRDIRTENFPLFRSVSMAMATAPTSRALEESYYVSVEQIVNSVLNLFNE